MPAKKGKSDYHRRDLRRVLLKEALEEVRRYGVAAASLRRIAQRAGVSHAAPYRHFRGKDGLLAALCWEGQAEFTAALTKARETGPQKPADRLFRLGDAYLDFAARRPEHFALMFSETGLRTMSRHPPDDLAEAPGRYESFGVLEKTVRECQAAGILDPRDESIILAVLIWSFVHGFALIRQSGFMEDRTTGRHVNGKHAEEQVMEAFRTLVLGPVQWATAPPRRFPRTSSS